MSGITFEYTVFFQGEGKIIMSKSDPQFDPSIFNDDVAMQTVWEPMKDSDSGNGIAIYIPFMPADKKAHLSHLFRFCSNL